MKFFDLNRLAVCAAVLLLGGLALASPPEGGYHLLKKYELGAAPGGKEYWDYIIFDVSTRRLYISHNTEVKIVDADSGAIIGNIADLKRVHGVALVDSKTLKVTAPFKTGVNPDCILYEPTSKHIFTMNGKSNDVSVIDPATAAVVATISVGGAP